MRKNLSAVIVIMVVAGYLRFWQYDKVPLLGDSLDEYSFSWVGLSLIRLGVPVGALGVGGYNHQIYKYVNPDGLFHFNRYNNPMEINYPWFDHPPLLGIITGGYSYIKGARVFEDMSLSLIRRPMVVLGIISVGLVMWLGKEMYDRRTGLVAGIIYAVSPIAVVGSRMVQAENGFIPLLLGAMICLVKYEKKAKLRYLIVASILAGLGIWMKLSAIVIFLIVIWQLVINLKKLNYLKHVGLIFGFFVAAYLVYGAVYDWKTFVTVFNANSNRYYGMGANALWELWTKVRITHTKFLTDGWVLSGWLATMALMIKKTIHPVHGIAIGLYLLIYLTFGNYPYGWYAWPFLPLIFLALGKVVSGAIRGEENALATSLMLFMPIGVQVSGLISGDRFQKYAEIWRLAIGGGLLATLWKKGTKFLVVSLLVVAFISSLLSIIRLTPEFWYKVI